MSFIIKMDFQDDICTSLIIYYLLTINSSMVKLLAVKGECLFIRSGDSIILPHHKESPYGPRRDKTCLPGFRQSKFQLNQSPQLRRLARRLKFHL